MTATLATADQPRAENPVANGCDCPRGDFCKHIVALLLTWLETPERFASRSSLSELLAAKSQAELAAVLELLVSNDLDLEDQLITLLALPLPGASPPGRELLDETAVRRQITTALPMSGEPGWRGYSRGCDDYDVGGGMATELHRVIILGARYATAGDWPNALRVYATFAEEIAPTFEQLFAYDDEGGLLTVVATADQGLADIFDVQRDLPAADQLSADDRQRLIDAIFTL